jgi:hypothetical protein
MHLESYRPPVRFASWGERGLSFWVRSQGKARRVAGLTFPLGPSGPYAGIVGSPMRRQYEDQVRAWVSTGELPEEAYG